MVHALHEAHRVLRPEGRLIDLRPAVVHRRVGLTSGGHFHVLGAMREALDLDRTANRAVAHVLRERRFQAEGRIQFECRRVLDSLDDLRAFVAEFATIRPDFPSHDWLIRRAERAVSAARGDEKLVVTGPLVMRVLRKLDK